MILIILAVILLLPFNFAGAMLLSSINKPSLVKALFFYIDVPVYFDNVVTQ